MSPISVLSDQLINKIAAGEVVERPASVVKELVENSLDANAAQIDVEVASGGKKSILVRDNGEGITPDDLRLAVARHATSKISSVDDLFSVNTLGFRGEALASIASVSKLTLTSKKKNSSDPAHEIYLEGGQIVSEGKKGHPDGTSISVKYLFYQTPARLKFLKSPETELSHITDYVIRAALGYPGVGIRLTHDDRKVLSTQATGDIRQRVRELFDAETAESSLEISGGHGGLEVFGLAGDPHFSRSHSRNIYLFVNNRPIRDKILFHAILEGYRNLLMRGRYPFVVLFLKVPSEMVDVNVHPTKNEVRFSNSSVIHRAVYEAVRKTLQATSNEQLSSAPPSLEGRGVGGGWHQERCRDHPLPSPPPSKGEGFEKESVSDLFKYETRQIESKKTPYSELEVIGQLLGTYILCQARDKLVLIDQHAAHERIGYEKLLKAHREGNIPSQQLLIPENFDLNPSDSEILKKYLGELESLGIEIEFFGGNTFVVKRLPVLFRKVQIKDFIHDLIGDALEKGSLTSIRNNVNAVLASIACHSAVRGGDSLSNEEMRSLLRDLDHVSFNTSCPHGRPVIVEITRSELERWFRRIV